MDGSDPMRGLGASVLEGLELIWGHLPVDFG
jgi:hypothetical protein